MLDLNDDRGPSPGKGWTRCNCFCHRAKAGTVMHIMACCDGGWNPPLFPPGKQLISGQLAFELHQTHGFPLSITIEQADARDATIDWEEFLVTALNQNWPEYRVYDLFQKQVNDSLISREDKAMMLKLMRALIVKKSPHLFEG